MKVLLTGKNGQVGFELERTLHGIGDAIHLVALDRSQLDLSDLAQVRDLIRTIQPNLIVNAAAYTAVDKAESEPALVMRVNTEAPGAMAEEAEKLGAAMIHYSTDYVFDGTKATPYVEDDVPNPLNVYGRSKLQGERAVASACKAHWIFRTSWVYGLHGSNFMKTILRLAHERDSLRVVADQHGAPTWSRSIARVTTDLLTSRTDIRDRIAATAGTYHLCASGSTTWYDYARHIVEQATRHGVVLTLRAADIESILTEAYPVSAVRPLHSRLNCEKLCRTFSATLPNWREDVNTCLFEMHGSRPVEI